MTLAPLLAAPAIIQVHAAAALGAFVLGSLQLLLRKGGTRHRLMGWVWVGLMAVVAVTSFWISEIRTFGAFSPIHLLSIFVLAQLPFAVHAARSRNLPRHRGMMIGLFLGALVVAGLFTMLPTRIIGRSLFGG